MEDGPDSFEEAARIVEAFAEGETDERVIELLAEVATAIRKRVLNS